MNGEPGVTKRVRLSQALRAWLVIGAFIAVVTTFNIFTAIHDAAEHGQSLAPWEPTTWEYTSGIAGLLCAGIICWAVRIAPPDRSAWPRFVAVHAVASFAFSSLHIVLMNAMRVAIYAGVGRHYQFGEAGFWYEYRKDLVAYFVWAAIFWFFMREPPAPRPPKGRRLIDIRDGKRLLRVPVEEITAIHAAGNYVEFVLVDHRRALVRQSLSAAERQLGDDFIRTHRSWAINASHVRGLRAVNAGDYEIELGCGIKVPLSRRFPGALARLRQPSSAAAQTE
jgi:hypothetical protein